MDKQDIKTAAEKAAEYTARQPWPVWVKVALTAAIAAAAAAASLLLTSCTPAHLEQVQEVVQVIRTITPAK